jgi:membrane-associated phospholipid phosphatase
MELLYQWGISIVLFVQNLGSWLLNPVQFISFFGTAEFYLLIMPALYWCFDAALGLRIGIILMVSNGLNFIIKMMFHTARPFWISRQVASYSFEPSFGMPSAHAQNSVAVLGLLAANFQRRWVWVVSLVAILLIGFSRVYLAVHFPKDVILGWIIGFLLVWIFLRLEGPVTGWFAKQNLGLGILVLFGFSMLILILGLVVREITSTWQLPQTWVENAHLAFPDEDPIDPFGFSISALYLTTGVLFGLSTGGFWIFLRGGFNAKGIWWKRVLRFLIGVVGVAVLWIGLGVVLPEPGTPVGNILYYFQYALIGFWISALAPLLFIRFNLAERE